MRLAIAMAAFALAGGAAGCGDSGDGNGGSGAANGEAAAGNGAASSQPASASAPPATGSDEQQVRAVFEQMAAAIESGDGASACAVLERKQARGFASVQGAGGSCAEGFAIRTQALKMPGTRPAQIEEVQIAGTNATVLAVPKGENTPWEASLTKQGGRWKVATWLRSG